MIPPVLKSSDATSMHHSTNTASLNDQEGGASPEDEIVQELPCQPEGYFASCRAALNNAARFETPVVALKLASKTGQVAESDDPLSIHTSFKPSILGYPEPEPVHQSANMSPEKSTSATVHNEPAINCTPSSRKSATVTPIDTSTTLSEDAVKKEILSLLRETYTKYPSAEQDDDVEKMVLRLKALLLADENTLVRELKMELKMYLIAYHG
jgi:hypothetical protein